MKNGRLLATPVQPDVYTGPTYPSHIQMMEMKPSYIDSVAIVVDGDQGLSVRISILNRHPSADWKARISIPDFGERKQETAIRGLIQKLSPVPRFTKCTLTISML